MWDCTLAYQSTKLSHISIYVLYILDKVECTETVFVITVFHLLWILSPWSDILLESIFLSGTKLSVYSGILIVQCKLNIYQRGAESRVTVNVRQFQPCICQPLCPIKHLSLPCCLFHLSHLQMSVQATACIKRYIYTECNNIVCACSINIKLKIMDIQLRNVHIYKNCHEHFPVFNIM